MTRAFRVTLSCIAAVSLTAGCGDGDGASADSDPIAPATASALEGAGGGDQDASRPRSAERTARDAADRFAVLRDETRLTRQWCFGGQEPGSQTYVVRRERGFSLCASVAQKAICVWASGTGGGGGGGCFQSRRWWSQKLQKLAEGRFGVATTRTRDGDLIHALVPDGTRDASITYRDGTTEPVPIEDNFLGVVTDRPPARVSWTTPDGRRFTAEP